MTHDIIPYTNASGWVHDTLFPEALELWDLFIQESRKNIDSGVSANIDLRAMLAWESCLVEDLMLDRGRA